MIILVREIFHQMHSQAKTSGTKLPEVHGAQKG